MLDDVVNRILSELKITSNPVALLQSYQDRCHENLWRDDTRLYRAFGRKLISQGHPAKAFELMSEGLAHHPQDLQLQYLRAQALSRGGNRSKARAYCTELLKDAGLDAHLRCETISLQGKLAKDRYQRTADSAHARESAQLYAQAYQLSQKSFPAINAATLFLLGGDHEQARLLAETASAKALTELQHLGQSQDYWLLATLGEAHLLLGNQSQAAAWYGQAVQHARGQIGDIASMRRNVQLLQRKLEISKDILKLFDVGNVVVAVGHMIDHPQRLARTKLSERFPNEPALETLVRSAICQGLEELNATVGYCSGACGTDLLFGEEMLKRGKELHIVLPYEKEDFYRTSVDFGFAELAEYRQRFDKVVDQAQVHYGTRDGHLGDDELLAFVGTFVQGLAIRHAAELGVQPYALAVLDRGSPVLVGGTAYFMEKWSQAELESQIIDLAALRAKLPVKIGPVSTPVLVNQQATPAAARKIRRELKVMLFADVKNFSKLREDQAPFFFIEFLGQVVEVLQATPTCPVLCNTWGDGLFLVFNQVVDAADFAMRLLDRIQQVNWTAVGLPADTTVRIGLHAGPVYPRWDQLIGKQNFFGSHVNRAARIEPVTTPGCAFASEQFAALLAVEPRHDFACEYIGTEELAKGYDRCPLYRLERR